MENKVNITVSGDKSEVVILEGKAVEQREPMQVVIKGDVFAPNDFYKSRKDAGYFDLQATHVLVNTKELSVTLVANERSFYRDVIVGKLELSDEIEKLGINRGKTYSAKELANLLRRMSYAFDDKIMLNNMLLALNKVTAKVTANSAESQEVRGNTSFSKTVDVKTNIPESFILNIPYFQAGKATKIHVEVHLEACGQDVKIILESEQLYAEAKNMLASELKVATSIFSQDGVTMIMQ